MTPPAVVETDSPDTAPEHVEHGLRDQFEHLRLSQLVESGHNPRRSYDPTKLQELADSIRQKGIVEPLVVRLLDDADGFVEARLYEIVAGARRFRAATLAGLTHVPCVIRDYTDRDVLELFVIENTQRDDLSPLEEAAGYKQLLLIDQTYTAAMIAQRIGHTERYVWDRLRLLDLVPELQAHLTAGHIGVEHAEILAKLKPGEQRRAANPSCGALFEPDYALKFDDGEKPFGHKARSVRQLREWIARHVRFDVAHFAAAAPLEFGETAQRVAAAEAQEGRGKKVVPITFETMCPGDAKDDKERTYGATAWKRAVGKDGQPTCEHAVLGLVVAGEHYGESFHVCIARDRCTTHWKEQVAAKAKAEQLRASGKGKQAARVETTRATKEQDRWKQEEAERNRKRARWEQLGPALEKACTQAAFTMKVVPPKVLAASLSTLGMPATKPADVARMLVRQALDRVGFNYYGNEKYCVALAQALGVDTKPILAAAPATTPEKPKKAAKRR